MKTVIEMARQAGGVGINDYYTNGRVIAFSNEQLERFAALVRADEREACAKVAEDMNRAVLAMLNVTSQPKALAAAIRARGNT